MELTAEAVSLPDVKSQDPLQLGKVFITQQSELEVNLDGGDSGHGGKGSFTVEPATGADNPLMWEIRNDSPSGKPQPIAQLKIANQQLQFQWRPDAATNGDAPYLQNCLLDLKAGQDTGWIRLRQSQRVKAPQIKVTRKGLKPLPFRSEIKFLPDPKEYVFVEFQVDPARFGPSKMMVDGRPKIMVPAAQSELQILLGLEDEAEKEKKGKDKAEEEEEKDEEEEEAEAGALRLKIAVKTSGNKLQINAALVLRWPGAEKDAPFDFGKLKTAHIQESEKLQRAGSALDNLKNLLEDGQPSKKQQQQMAALQKVFKEKFGSNEPEKIQSELDKRIGQLEYVNQILLYVEGLIEEALAATDGKQAELPIEVRVYRSVRGVQVELLKTGGWQTDER